MDSAGDRKTDIVGIIPVHEGSVLYLKRSQDEKLFPDKWCIPSGHMKEWESESDAAYREFIEETGIRSISKTDIKFMQNFNYSVNMGGKKLDLKIALFYAELNGTISVKLCDEHTDYRFINIKHLTAEENLGVLPKLRGLPSMPDKSEFTEIDLYIIEKFIKGIDILCNGNTQQLSKQRMH
ncbi:NUDIX domain-containing protein [Candidatus Marsarchaeota archaeon]|jgi:8-oxo-dGTP pyrophosphatase MutT (NUDIX family)|nr:NUDIX domain-containing protein [Candidatus Marsarchaeota archaeon]MCL5092492.1 NUDIX domain-containing protein [Candidatus Marsarchaeota archaeon]